MTNLENKQVTTQFTEGDLNITIQGNIMTVVERGYPDDVYQIVEVAPIGYEVWNIGDHMPNGYIPYAQCGGYDGRQVNRDTLKAIRIK